MKGKQDMAHRLMEVLILIGERRVCSVHDAYCCFMSNEIGYLVIGDFVYYKKEHLNWENKDKWMLSLKRIK